MEDFLQKIADDVREIFNSEIQTTQAYVVPSRNDNTLTFPVSGNKRGKLIETCVLFIDIRNSTRMSRDLKKDKARLGKIYSAFIYAMTKIADEYGYVRNIIGDRIMVVFEPNKCFKNAIDCAALMYTTAHKIIKHYSKVETFKIGIGIDYGEMLVLKTGIIRKHEEQSEYKSLVWVGDTANIASKLTDFANKEYDSSIYNITYEEVVQTKVPIKDNPLAYPPLRSLYKFRLPKFEDVYLKEIKYVTLDTGGYLAKVNWDMELKYENRRVISIKKETQIGVTNAVLISGKVYRGLKEKEPQSLLLKKFEAKGYPKGPDTGSGIYGGYLLLPEHSKIKLQ